MAGDQAAEEAARRLQALYATGLLDTAPEPSFDRHTRLAARLLKVPVSLVSLVDSDRQFFKSCDGLPEPWASQRQTPLSHSFCKHVVDQSAPLVIEDAREHPLVCNNAAIEDLNVVAYLGIPLVDRDGCVLGAFCAIDGTPRRWRDEDIETMQSLAASVMTEIELRVLASDSLARLAALNRLEQERDEMLHMLVHDLRNPLSGLLASLDMAQVIQGLSARHIRYLDRARRGGESLLEMINEILTINQAEAGMLSLDKTGMRPAALLLAVHEQLSPLADASGIELVLDVEDSLPEVSVDTTRLKRVLVNLVGNAIDHTPVGGQVLLQAVLQGDEMAFVIEDTGPGVPEDEREQIFEKYYRASKGGRGAREHSGLGLAFCRKVVEAHGGSIRVETGRRQGACFVFALPLARETSNVVSA